MDPNPRHLSARHGSANLTLRSDIQSLRALAVALVVAAHAHVPGLSGGYVGVDVFFVLSGYLISGLILREIESTGQFDPGRFYAKRLKRLLPAMLLVYVCTAIVARFVVSPQQQASDSAAGQAAMVWLSNFYFSSLTIDYFSTGENGNLFIHTWSLAVEEQFYLIWPWLLMFLYGYWKWQGVPANHASTDHRRLAYGLGIVAAISLLLCAYLAYRHVEDGFYLMPGRVWEFALGALSFLLRRAAEEGRAAWLERLRGRSLLNAVGWLSILLAAVAYGDALRYPGFWALLPCMGAVLVLLDAPQKSPESRVSRLMLRASPLQFIGNVSYGLYLWHWPVLILGAQLFGSGALTNLGLVSLCVGLAAATYFAAENPIHRAPLRNVAKVLILSVSGMALGFLVMWTWQREAAAQLKMPELAKIQAAKFDLPNVYSLDCDTWHHSAELSACAYGPENASHTAIMFGDSVLVQWFPAISDIYLRKPGWRLIVLTKSACPASQVSFYYERIKATYEVCDLWRQRALGYIEQLRPEVLIMGSNDYGFSADQWITGTRAVLDRLSPATHTVFIMSPTPTLGFDGPNCLSTEANLPHWSPRYGRCETRLKSPAGQSILRILSRAASPYQNVHVIDLSDSVCPDGLCKARFQAGIRFRDGKHLTASFVRSMAPALERALGLAGEPR
ncbi:MAG: acyltransferase [Burkholderiales bacterium]|nr:acyltransferase [Burkholderiales bacterium]